MRRQVGLLATVPVVLTLLSLVLGIAWSEPQPGAPPAGQPSAAPSASPSAATPGANSLDLNGPPAKRILKRNPFVPPLLQQASTGHVGPRRAFRPIAKVHPVEAPPPPPTFTLAGIFSSRGFPTALLLTGHGPVAARVGDVISGYKVTSINLNNRQVIVEMRKHPFRVSLPKDTPYGRRAAAAGGGARNAGSGEVRGGVLPPPPAPTRGEGRRRGGRRRGGAGGGNPAGGPPPGSPGGPPGAGTHHPPTGGSNEF